MPIYAFACEACGHQFDRLQKMSDPDPELCPECGKAQIRRQLTAPSFRLAGGGWYETDFKTDRDKKHHLAGDRDTSASGSDKKDSKHSGADKSGSGQAASGKSDSGKSSAQKSTAGTSSASGGGKQASAS